VVSGLAPLSVARRITGPVVTVKLGAGMPAGGPLRHLGTTAIGLATAGDVIVVEQGSGIEAGSWGGILTLGARLRGVAGVVADGPVRDVDEARGHDFPVYARSCTARTARGRIVELGTNVPVTIGAVEVHPGDYVVADSSGVAFIPAAQLERVLAAAEAIARREAAMMDLLRAGRAIHEVMGADYEGMLQRP
jgi:regulator of RNase E activity RraA